MKKIVLISIIALALATTFSACTTYEEGPSFSLLSPSMRIKGTWDQTAIYINEQLEEGNDIGIEFTFNSDGTGTSTTSLSVFGEVDENIVWKFNEEKTMVLYRDADAEESAEWNEAQILRLTSSEMWLVIDTIVFGEWKIYYEKI
jgi:hypothetical protein